MTASPEPLALPSSPAEWPPFADAYTADNLRAIGESLDVLKDGAPRSALETLGLWNDAEIALRNAESSSLLLSEVHPDAAVRTLLEERAQEADRVRTARGQDRALYEVLAATDPAGLGPVATRLRERILLDFHRAGVDASEEVRARLAEIAERSTVLSQEFGRAIRDDVRSIRVTAVQLDGLPEDFVAEHPLDEDGLATITTDYPDVLPFRTFATDAAARRALTTEFLNRAWPANDAVLAELIELRAEQAELLGYASWPDFDAEVKMVGGAAAIAEFIDRLSVAAEVAGRRDQAVLLDRLRQEDPSATGIDISASEYLTELIRREWFGVDGQAVRRYFDAGRVRQGLLDVTSRLFGVEYRARPDAPTWHEEVTAYDVLIDDEVRGRIFLDLHPREGKFKHAAAFELRPGVAGRQLPEGALACNFSRGLMEHDDVVTLFHEFGHLVHFVLGGQQEWVKFSGFETEWDFVEAPSQLLEEWAWDARVLQTFAFDESGEPIPADLVHRMREANEFGNGLFVRRQVFYSALSYGLHAERPADLTARMRQLQEQYDLLGYIEGTHLHASFGHLTDYSSAYYTYMWSLVIAKDLFSAFDPADLFDPAVSHRYRDLILARGGNTDAAVMVSDFLGRPYSFGAFAAWLDTPPRRPGD